MNNIFCIYLERIFIFEKILYIFSKVCVAASVTVIKLLGVRYCV